MIALLPAVTRAQPSSTREISASDTLVPIAAAQQLAATGDTAGAVRILKAAAEASPRNAPLWHAYGMILYAWTKPHWRKMPMPAGIPQRIVAAESSLARAMTLAPDSAQYAIDYARNLFNTNTTSLSAAQRAQTRAVTTAERMGDTALAAKSAAHLGMLLWRKFDQDADRYIENPGVIVEAHRPGQLEQTVKRKYAEIRPPRGAALYQDAVEYFRFARQFAPDDEQVFRREAMALSHKLRWPELRTASLERIVVRPQQPWPWLAKGLAEQRLHQYDAARASFDSGFRRLPEEERYRLLFLPRLWRPGNERWFDTLSSQNREHLQQVYWTNSDPSLLLPGNPMQTEFLARVVNAEISWTDDEKPLNGAESPKGEVYIRFGPADFIANERWYYYTPIDTFFEFRQVWGYGTAGLKPQFIGLLDSMRRTYGSTFFNLPLLRRGVDTIPFTVARFRAPHDSVDLFTTSLLPVGTLRRGLATSESHMRNAFFTLDGNAEVLTDTRSTVTVRGGDSTSTLLRTQRTRAPSAARLGRLELLEPDAERVARAVFDISGFLTRGFGISDLVVSATIRPPEGGAASRWTNYTIEPSLGDAFKRGTPVDLLWEVYGLTPTNGSTKHRVTITVNRIEEKGLVAVGARIVGGIQNAVRGSSSQSRLAISYERTLPPRDAFAEYIRLDLQGNRVGRYQLTLTIEDLVTGQATRRVRELRVW